MTSAECGKSSIAEQSKSKESKECSRRSKDLNQADTSKSRLSNSDTDDVAKYVEDENFYHGLLPREDISSILEKIRHIVVRKRKKEGGAIEWRAIEADGFSSVKELIENYIAARRPINPEIKTSVLIRPIKRKPWEFLHEDIKLKDLLGEGQFGEVRSGEALVNGRRLSVAIKVVSVQNTPTKWCSYCTEVLC
ncbi:Tyrosine-protein kinase Fer [Toxocara canis]|uniref:Tyrosine-protein kinase Fer n=1 Tax=Toxocara canis TaxID=6265 RepID=A0A0B2W5B7_TOXCA|nr:Tyrosine-protein kinase Fer [Toxocara canis]